MNYRFTKQQAYGLGIQILNILEKIHGAGYVFNDLKLDNLLLDFDIDTTYLPVTNANFFDTLNINIIDFGFATSYIDHDTKKHMQKAHLKTFRGNVEFSSLNQMKFHTTSPRDDLISLFYLLVFIIKGGKLACIDRDPNV